MKIAVFGANGYLGQHLVYYLNQKGHRPVCFDIQNEMNGNLTGEYHRFDITDKTSFVSFDESFEYLYFFSGLTGTDVSIDRYEDYIKVNETGLLHLLQRVKGFSKKPKIIFPSTRLVYKGIEDTPLAEDAPKEFKTIYASSKYNGELYLQMFRNLYGIDYTVFRICVPYGNAVGGQLSYGTIGFFLDRATKSEPISLFGDGRLKRTFTHVMDVCRQIVDVAELAESNGQCYNTDGETYSLLDVAGIIGKKYNVPVVFKEWPAKALQLESGDTIFDPTRIKKMISPTLYHAFQQWINE